ncbi:thiamine pyrophosphate-dependent enzyme [Streptomyces halobius]|uniref:Thiamine pyrophosphate enzyme TPP-binding domain-containing protein n=1 Tax=Streptomyces halobius TaxID=2879846 RepID=A0ABY4M929_9ACTN|nr:thiamine pyrophosphate-dependent enzyme [Streptomyces halobius]UQA94295.1 hypothetical protein K9S39_22730 [Streptomyces halobius]
MPPSPTHGPLLYVVLDNGGYGWLQTDLDRMSGTGVCFAFTADRPTATRSLADPYGLRHWRVDNPEDLDRVLGHAWQCCASGTAAVVEAGCPSPTARRGWPGPTVTSPLREDA